MPILQIKDKNGNFIPIPAIKGNDGKSAYEQAKEGGYTGTEEEFIAFLNGALNPVQVASDDPSHYTDYNNPHKVTKEQLGLGNVKVAGAGGSVGAEANAEYGGAVGYKATTSSGGAVGNETTSSGGGAMGHKATTTTGGAVGSNVSATTGGAVGENSETTSGGAVGSGALSTNGGAIGLNAKTSNGVAIGLNAKTVDDSGEAIDAIQLGTGKNTLEKTLQVYGYQMMDANGKIPNERLPIATGSYVGTGTFGESNKNSLTFPFIPKIVFISAVENVEAAFHLAMPIIQGCATARIHFRVDASSDRCYSDCIYLTWNDKTLSWYSTNQTYKASMQLNVSGVTYKYVAIG